MDLRALVFDYGGTLDAPGVPWVDRFLEIYRLEQLSETEERMRAAFGHATRCAYADNEIGGFGLDDTVAFHVNRQLEFLERVDAGLARRVAERFLRLARTDLAHSRAVLRRLQGRFALAVISNFYGNVHVLLAEAGIAPLLTTVVDSNRVGVSKPNPAIFHMATDKVGCAPGEAIYVGDSFEKDVVGAHGAGLQTAWLVGYSEPHCPNPSLVNLRLRDLSELEGLLP